MTPEEELKKLNHLIRQYESVYHTTKNIEQRERVAKQLKELRSSRQTILDEHLIDAEAFKQAEALDEFKHLRRLLEGERRRTTGESQEATAGPTAAPVSAHEEIFNLMLYARFFRNEFLPFLAEKRLKLDYKFSLERRGFYGEFNELERKLHDFREEDARSKSNSGREIAVEVRKRMDRLKLKVRSDAARFFRSVQRFCEDLMVDADGDGVMCLNGREEIAFEDIEGKHLLEGRKVRDALEVLAGLASEVVAYLKVPESDSPG
ncbi:MAG: hypothetical protein ABSG17_08530 [Spirochaetia bacterium]|jgi:hypothetical protein